MNTEVEHAVEIFLAGWVQPETEADDYAGMWATEILAAAWLEQKFRRTRDSILKSSGRLIDRAQFIRESRAIVALPPAAEVALVVHNVTHPERAILFHPVQLQTAPPKAPRPHPMVLARR
jgi:hypothetical protein